MIAVYFLLFIISFVVTYLKFKALLRINFIYTVLWSMGGFVVSINYCGLYDISVKTHIYIIFSIIIINIVCFFCEKENEYNFTPKWRLKKINFQIIVLLHVVSYAFMIPILLRAFQIILSEGWASLRAYAYTESHLLSSGQLVVYSWIINPLFSMTFLIAAILFMSNSKYKRIIFRIACIDLIVITLAFGGRNGIVKFVLFIIISFFMKNSFEGRRSKIKLKYILIGFGVGVLLVYLTSLRSLTNLSFIQNVVVYLFGSIVYFDLITQPGFAIFNSVKLYGNATFGVFTSIPMYFLYRMTGLNLTPEYLIDLTSNDSLYISNSYRYNALTTWLYPFWKDAGFIGIIVGVLFVTILFIFLKKRVIKKQYMSTYALTIYIVYVVFTSTMTYNFMTIQHSVTLIMLIFFTRNAKIETQIMK